MINKEIMDALCFLHSLSKKDKEFETQTESFKQVVNYIEDLEAKINNKWIPCEERLPSEENEDYLICTNEAHVRILLWTKRGWNTFIDSEGKYHTGAEIKNVIAWKPLPQPYKKEGAENAAAPET